MKTTPENIKNPTYLAIWAKLQSLPYPCTIVVYGAERTHRTTYRGEHDSRFSISLCDNAMDAWACVDCGWVGYPPDLKVYAICGNELKELSS